MDNNNKSPSSPSYQKRLEILIRNGKIMLNSIVVRKKKETFFSLLSRQCSILHRVQSTFLFQLYLDRYVYSTHIGSSSKYGPSSLYYKEAVQLRLSCMPYVRTQNLNLKSHWQLACSNSLMQEQLQLQLQHKHVATTTRI